MQENHKTSDTVQVDADEVVIKRYIVKFGNSRRYLYSQWKLLLIAALIGAIAGLFYTLFRKTNYTAECTFVMEEGDKTGGGMGQYSALASMAGIDVGGSTGLFQSDNITQLYRSRLMLQKTLLTPANFNGRNQLLIDRYLEINKLRKAWADNPALRSIDFSIPKERFTMVHDSLISMIIANINKNYLSVDKPDKKLSMVSVKVVSPDQLFSKAFTEAIVSNVNNFYVQTKTKKAIQNVQLLQRQSDSVHRILNASIGNAASAYDANPNPDPAVQQMLRAPSQRRQVEVQATTGIYAEVVRNLEIAKTSLQRETPLIQVIDQPVLPLPNDRLSKRKAVMNGGLIGLLLGIVMLFTLRVYRGIMS